MFFHRIARVSSIDYRLWLGAWRMPTEEDIRAYEERRADLEQQYSGKFVVFQSGKLVGAFDDFDSADKAALRDFGDSPVLIRKVGDSALKHVSISVIRSL
jgi:hypothetical protein